MLTDVIYVIATESMEQEDRDKFETNLQAIRDEVDLAAEARRERQETLMRLAEAQMK